MNQKQNKQQAVLFLLTSLAWTPIAEANPVEELLTLSLADLSNLEIFTASKTEEKIRDIPASVVVIGRTEIERHGLSESR